MWRELSICSLLVLLDVLHDVPDGSNLLGVFVRDLHFVFFFQGHHELYDVERVGAQVLDERSLRRDFFFSYAEVLADDFAYSPFGVFSRRFGTRHVRPPVKISASLS